MLLSGALFGSAAFSMIACPFAFWYSVWPVSEANLMSILLAAIWPVIGLPLSFAPNRIWCSSVCGLLPRVKMTSARTAGAAVNSAAAHTLADSKCLYPLVLVLIFQFSCIRVQRNVFAFFMPLTAASVARRYASRAQRRC